MGTCFRMLRYKLFSRLRILQLAKIFICPSHECNANCPHCYEKFVHKNFLNFLTTRQIKSIIDQFFQLGGYSVIFCSGEFLLRDDALDLVKYARLKNMATHVVTNGLLLDEKKIDELKAAGLTELIISIDSANASKHDELRGIKGCFEKAINGLRMAKQKNILTRIWTYASKNNINDLEEIVKLSEQLGSISIFIFFIELSGHLFNRFDENLTYQERETFRERFNHRSGVLLEFPEETGPCRGGGFQHICVMPSGDVTYCPPVPYSYGNINSRSLKECLKDIITDYRRFSHCTGQCIVNFSEYREKCNARFIYG